MTTTPTALEVAAALRSAADFCRDPESPKAHGVLALRTYRDPETGSLTCDPSHPKAVSWCAVGYTQRALGISGDKCIYRVLDRYGLDWDPITEAFDDRNYEAAAAEVSRCAAEIEASLPVTDSESVGRGSDVSDLQAVR